MTRYVSSGTLNSTNSTHSCLDIFMFCCLWLSVSPVAECSSPEPPHCLTGLCQQHASTSNTGPQSTGASTSPTEHTLPNSSSNSAPAEYAVPSSLRTTAPQSALPCTASLFTAPETSVKNLPCNSSGSVVTSIWGCPLRNTEITAPPHQPC